MALNTLASPRSFHVSLISKISTPELEGVEAQKETEFTKDIDPFNAAEMAVKIAIEQTRTIEALKTRDAVVQRLVEAHESLRQKSATIEILQQTLQQKSRGSSPFAPEFMPPATEIVEIAKMKDEIARLEQTITELRTEIQHLKEDAPAMQRPIDPPPCYEDGVLKNVDTPQHLPPECPRPISGSNDLSNFSRTFQSPQPLILRADVPSNPSDSSIPSAYIPASDDPADVISARNAILASLPLPKEVPEDTLSPLSIPAPLTLQEFICTLTGPLRLSLSNYRIFYATTTQWCPEREEHGCFYTPVFKCSTNPRVATAHRWNAVDVVPRINKSTECFFAKDGIWYYAGAYETFRLADLTTKEWAELPVETTQAIVKETIVGRRNTSPQNIYEINQLYAAGALKVACIALQCVGFNNGMYAALLEQARIFTHSKWASTHTNASMITGKLSPAPSLSAGGGASGGGPLGSGSAWNANSGGGAIGVVPGRGYRSVFNSSPLEGLTTSVSPEVLGSMAAMSLERQNWDEQRNENIPTPIGEGRKR